MSAREMLLSEIERLPEPVIEETLLFIRFAARQRENNEWADVLPSRAVEQEVLDILDSP
jgi:hypothetical protein